MVLSSQIPVALCNPVPQQAENEPAACEHSHKQKENKPPANLHKGGPEVYQVRKLVTVLDVPELNVAVPVFGDQAGSVVSLSSWLVVTLEQLEHPGAGGTNTVKY